MRESRYGRTSLTFGRLLTCAFLLGLVLRVGFALTVDETLHWPDSRWYFDTAEQISSGKGIGNSITRAPLYPYFLSLLFLVSHRLLFVRVCESLLAALAVALVGVAGRRLFSDRVGLVAAFAAAVYPYFVYLPSAQVSDNLVTLLLLVSVLALVWGRERTSWRHAAVSGVFLGLCMLARPSLVTVVPALAAWPVFCRGRGAGLALAGKSLLVVAVSVLTVLPWTARNYAVTGHFVFVATGGGRQFWYGNSAYADARTTENPEFPPELKARLLAQADEPSRERLLYQEGLRFVKENPGRALRLYASKLANLFQLYPSVHTGGSIGDRPPVRAAMAFVSAVLFGLSLIGAALVFAAGGRATILPLMIVSYCLGSAVFLTVMRYRLPVDPYLILLASAALGRMLGWPVREQTAS
ncbi:MAG: glycosyltransferase family 39 protein [Candidatus Eisenbacteria bacterium]|nr:glycosyltransferase family 39 protein [Candidatus Eisenbacteria bacterium]